MADNQNITLGQLLDFAEKADIRLDRLELNMSIDREITIPATGWTSDSGDAEYPYQYSLAVEGVTAASKAEVTLNSAGVVAASNCGLYPGIDTAAGKVIFKSYEIPTTAMSGVLSIKKEAATVSST